jgi:tRNA (guanine37-N1)-methyltransferase
MVLKVEPIYRAVKDMKKSASWREKVILFTPRGKKFNQRLAYQFSKLNQIIMVCGRYEGVDERVARHLADIELSIGDYDLMGGELPAMVVMETVSRLVPGVLGKPALLKERITKEKGFIEYPQYTRPEVFLPKKGAKWRVPKVLISGNHKEIEKWRKKNAKTIGK